MSPNPISESLLAKLEALRARAQRTTNMHEAAACAAAFERLIQKHQIDQAAFERASSARAEALAPIVVVAWPRDRETPWITHLAHFLAEQYNCDALVEDINAQQDGVVVFGAEADIETLRFMLAMLTSEIARLAEDDHAAAILKGAKRAARHPLEWKTDFAIGALSGIERAMRKTKQATRREATSTALVAIGKAHLEAERALANYVSGSTVEVAGVNIQPRFAGAYDRGERAGKKLARGRQSKQLKGA